jgi:hypothetical protein
MRLPPAVYQSILANRVCNLSIYLDAKVLDTGVVLADLPGEIILDIAHYE